ncbi:hypothetical protein [Kitasatospora herbaricolor]|uniref:hypothetical protein n=1 Tax=Kitasatospora herbaricolor TaxID=68217 RepID=UPI002E320C81|nr:hypothetical protein [Kitasatospora herbaricolor]
MTAWTANLGVLATARGRGPGSYLLRRFLAHYAALGRTRGGLGVGTGNSSGALARSPRPATGGTA